MEEIKEIAPREGKYRTFQYIQNFLDGTSGVIGEFILVGGNLYFDGKPSEILSSHKTLAYMAKEMKELEKKIKNGF